MINRPPPLIQDDDGASTAYLIERASVAIGRLDAQVSASSMKAAWQLRAAWTGFAVALQLSGVEIDEIDVFSWGSGIALPHRPRRQTLLDPFEAFEPWRARMSAKGRHWVEELPFSVRSEPARPRVPLLIRALELQMDYVRADRSIDAWLVLPILLHRLGLCETPLPCLVAGDRQLRFAPRDTGPAQRRILRALEAAALNARKTVIALENHRAIALAALAAEHRPTALRALAALFARAPMQSPESVARQLGMTLSGAGKLLARAAASGLVCEVSGRRAWRAYVVPDLAISLGLVAASKGRPPTRPSLSEPSREIASILADFDSDMAAFDARFGATIISEEAGRDG